MPRPNTSLGTNSKDKISRRGTRREDSGRKTKQSNHSKSPAPIESSKAPKSLVPRIREDSKLASPIRLAEFANNSKESRVSD